MDEIDILVIGAGVVGLSIAKAIAGKDKNIVVLEKNSRFGQETSSRNSEVIHGGMYYPSDTLKAKMCIEGRHLLYEICQKNNIPYKKIGKLIFASDDEEIPVLYKLFNQGTNNGVEGLKIIDRKEIKKMEPNLKGLIALYSPETGIFDSHKLMKYFYDNAKSNGAIVIFNSEVAGIEKLSDGYKVLVKEKLDTYPIKTKIIVNSAGLDSDNIATMAGIDTKKYGYEIHPCKGCYFRVSGNKASLINRLVYPVPKPKSGGLGIHATLDMGGGLRLGPDDEYLKNKEKNYNVDISKQHSFYSSAKIFMPFLEESDLSPDVAGIRPKLQGQNEPFRDFIIQEESGKGLPGLINLVGIESPGLTASPAIGRYVKNLIEKIF